MRLCPPRSTLFPYTTLFRSVDADREKRIAWWREARFGLFIHWGLYAVPAGEWKGQRIPGIGEWIDRKSTRLNSSHLGISYAVFCLKKKNNITKIYLLAKHSP